MSHLPQEVTETLRGQELKKLLSFLSELWLIPLLGGDSGRAQQLSTVNRAGNINISIQTIGVWEGGPSRPFPPGLALGQRGDGGAPGLRALREGGSRPTPEHTPGGRGGTRLGSALPPAYSSHRRNVLNKGFLAILKTAQVSQASVRGIDTGIRPYP